MSNAVKISNTGIIAVVDFEPGLKFLQHAVDGYIEAVDFDIDDTVYTMWLNEEGKIYGLAANDIATSLVRGLIMSHDYIAGNVVITGGTDEDGDTLSLSDDETAALLVKILIPS